jgi:hypothetical protein
VVHHLINLVGHVARVGTRVTRSQGCLHFL